MVGVLIVIAGSCKKDDDNNINPNNTFTDTRDGTVYKIVTIGNQVWMAENLKYLPTVTTIDNRSLTEPYNYVYEYNGTDPVAAKATAYFQHYGVLYNWPAAIIACPPGWRLPTDADWTELTIFAGGENFAGDKLRSTRTEPDAHPRWSIPNTGATDVYGFSAMPGGYLDIYHPAFYGIGGSGWWWSAAGIDESTVPIRQMTAGSVFFRINLGKDLGFSVRCIRD